MRVESNDLNGGTITQLVSALKRDAEDCTALKGAIGDFIGVIEARESLDGASYQAVKGKLSSYQSIIDQRRSIANDLANAITSATGSMLSYMGGESYLDMAELDGIRQNLNAAINTLNAIKTMTNDDGPPMDTSAITATIKQLQQKIEKLEGLPAADASAFGAVSGVSMASFNSNIGGMTPISINH